MTSLARLSALGLSAAALTAGMLVGAPSNAAPPTTSDTSITNLEITELGDGSIRGEGYVVTTGIDKLSVGEKGFITVKIQANEGYKVNDQYPHKIKFKNAPDGISLPKIVKKAEGTFESKSLFVFRVPVTANKAGKYKISGKLKFSVCNDKSCIIQKKRINVLANAQ